MFTEKRIEEFLDELASKAPVPGGGSGSALGGALGAGLLSMVCNLTLGKKGYEGVQEEMQTILTKSESLRARLSELLEEDTRVYSELMSTYRLPKETPQDKQTRTDAIQAASKSAADVPLAIAGCCSEIIDLCLPAARKGNKWAVSDAGVSVVLAEASMRGALLNVEINLASIKDQGYIAETRARVESLTRGKSESKEQVMSIVLETIRG